MEMFPGLRVGPSTVCRFLVSGLLAHLSSSHRRKLGPWWLAIPLYLRCGFIVTTLFLRLICVTRSLKYRLPENLRLHPAQAITLRASTNIRADVFEVSYLSYTGPVP